MADILVEAGMAICWGLVVLVWIVGAMSNARSIRQRRVRDRSGLPAYVAAVVVSAVAVSLGYAYLHAISFDVAWVRWLGLVVLAASSAFSIWARVTLGGMWSVEPEVRGDRRLRTTGPYGVTRHPIYTGLLGMVIGSTLLAGGHELVAVVVVLAVLFEIKIHQEERLLLAVFPDEYAGYRRRVPQIVPGLRVPRPRR